MEVFNTAALAALIEEAVKKAVPQADPIPERAWSVEDCANFLGCATGTVYTLAQNGEIPCRKI